MNKSKSEFIFLLDARCIPEKGYLESMLNVLLTGNYALVTGNIRFYYTKNNLGELIDSMVFVTTKECVDAREGVPTGSLLFKRSLIKKIGFFREDMRSAADGEWSQRVWDHGLSIGYAENGIVKYGARSFNRLLKKGFRDGRGHFQYARLKSDTHWLKWYANAIARMRPASKRYIKYCLQKRLGIDKVPYSNLSISMGIWVYRIFHSIGRLGL